MKKEIVYAILGFVVMFAAQSSAIWLVTGKANVVGKFNLSGDKIAKDLDGRAVTLMLNQVWPFDSSQKIDVQVLSKRQMDDFVVVVVDVKALAAVQQADTPKEQFSTSTTSKEMPKNQPKLPSKLQLNGKMKLTYELVDNDWYLWGIDNLSLRASPFD